ncbi:hypothetical protein C8Q80DRAFT_1149514, partial [Daedaleopsis nitida]
MRLQLLHWKRRLFLLHRKLRPLLASQRVTLYSLVALVVPVCTYELKSMGTSGDIAWAFAVKLLVKLSVMIICFVILILQWYIDLIGGDQVAEKVSQYLALTSG